MRVYIHAQRPSNGALEIVGALRALGVDARRLREPKKGHPTPGSLIVNWGERWKYPTGTTIQVVNNSGFVGKMTELRLLKEKGVRVPEFSWTKPATNPESWLGRSRDHVGGEDLLNGCDTPDFWTKKEEFKHEFRIHIWKGLTLKVGLKVPMEGVGVHSWIRSRAAGWKISYGEDAQKAIKQKVRDEARKAVQVLGLDFGAVDVGVLADGTPVVLEVNRAPGADSATANRYAEKIKELAA